MKKIFKQYFIYLLTIIITLVSCPIGVLAKTVNVGVNITGGAIIEYVATISSNINIDLTEKNYGQAYLKVVNLSSRYLRAKISDIEATSQGAPNNFVDYNEKNWATLDAADTATYISFMTTGMSFLHDSELGVSLTTLAEEGGTIYNAEKAEYTGVEIGTLAAYDDSTPIELYDEYVMQKNEKVYEVYVTVGYAWEETKNFTYSLTIVTEIGGDDSELVVNANDTGNKAIYDAVVDITLDEHGLSGINGSCSVSLLADSSLKLRDELESLNVAADVSRAYITFYTSPGLAGDLEYELAFNQGENGDSLKNGGVIFKQSEFSYNDGIQGEFLHSLIDGETYYIPYMITINASANSVNPLRENYYIMGVASAVYTQPTVE